MKHPHAELMMEYAKDAMETERPWERWEFKICGDIQWTSFLDRGPNWTESHQYRRKPKTININGYEVPEPVRKPLDRGAGYFAVILDNADMAYSYIWQDDITDKFLLERGFIHLAIEDAIIHGKALASFTEKKE